MGIQIKDGPSWKAIGSAATQAEAEAGTESALRMFSPLRVKQAIAALAPGGSSVHTFGITVDGGGSPLTAGSKGFITVPYDCTITDWYLVGEPTGFFCLMFDIKRNGISLIGGDLSKAPRLIDGSWNSNKGQSQFVLSWDSVTVTDGDILEFVLLSIEGIEIQHTRVNLVIKAT